MLSFYYGYSRLVGLCPPVKPVDVFDKPEKEGNLAFDADSSINVAEMGLDGALPYSQGPGQLVVVQSSADEPGYLKLSCGQMVAFLKV
jgi:hypothetical protein